MKEGEAIRPPFFVYKLFLMQTQNHGVYTSIRDAYPGMINPCLSARVYILLMILIIAPFVAFAQFPEKTQSFAVSPADSVIQLDLLSLAHSIRVTHADSTLSGEHWHFNRNTGQLVIQWPRFWTSLPTELSITWQYQPLSLQRTYSLREPVQFQLDESVDAPEQTQFRRTSQADVLGTGSLQSSGSITRGVIVGSNRDLGLESGLRFDLQGYITDDVYITAALSDQNTLIQPDGTTQNLREFDQVYIRLDAPRASLQLGDVDVRLESSGIARLNRRLQGAEGSFRLDERGEIRAAAAVVRGTFRTVNFNGREGIQGPYRLINTGNESFIIVVAGTERVYLDGRLLTRGDENDYVIDYSIGEIYFTNRRLIRNAHRIRVEYQYLSTGFSRTLTAAETNYHDIAGGRIRLGATFIREADNITFDEAAGLTATDIDILREAGTNTDLMRASGADSVGFRRDAPFVLYSRVDTTVSGQQYSIFKHIPGDESGAFRVQFSRVEQGTGSYRRSGQTVNGLVYEWVGPGQGSYEPFRRLQAPQVRQVLALRAGAELAGGLSVSTEWGVSNSDVNRYSSEGTAINDQMLQSRLDWRDVDLGFGRLNAWSGFELKGRNFEFFDRVRDVEFERRWDIRGGDASREERLEVGFDLDFLEESRAEWVLQRLGREAQSGVRQDLVLRVDEAKAPDLDLRAGYLNSDRAATTSSTRWSNINTTIGYSIPIGSYGIRPFYTLDAEERLERDEITSELRFNSFSHVEHTPGLQLVSASNFQLMALYSIREDYESLENQLQKSFITTSPELDVQFNRGSIWNSRNRIAYRNQQATELFREVLNRSDVKGIAIRSANDFRFLNRGIETSVLYDVASESRSVLQETYLEVGPEFGQYVWIDLNGDGVQQIDEFFPEQTPDEGTFIQQLLPSEELFPVISLQARWRLLIDPSQFITNWRSRSDLTRFLGGTQYTSTVDIREQNQTEEIREVYLLNLGSFRDAENTLTGRISWNQELQLLRHLQDAEIRIGREQTESLVRQVAGIEEFSSVMNQFDGRYSVLSNWDVLINVKNRDHKNNNTELFSRNYDLKGWELTPGIRWRYSDRLQNGAQFTYGRKQDRASVDGADLEAIRVQADGVYFFKDDLQIRYRGEYRNMSLTGQTSSLGEFELTDGAGLGSSWMWGVQFTWNVNEWVRTTFRYDGRTVQYGRNIQTMRLTVTATF